jgi:hypothetical protein
MVKKEREISKQSVSDLLEATEATTASEVAVSEILNDYQIELFPQFANAVGMGVGGWVCFLNML